MTGCTESIDLSGADPPVITPLVYVVSRWGAPTETFVRREAASVAARGVPVSTFSLKRPVAPRVAHLSPVRVVFGVLTAAVRRPAIVGDVARTVWRESTGRTRVRRLAAASVGLAAASTGAFPPNAILHAHFGWVAATAAWAAARLSGNTYTVVLHAFELHSHDLQDAFMGTSLREATRVFTISDSDRALVERRWGISATRLRMGVPRTWLVGDDVRRDEHLIVSVASLVAKKGHATLVRAVAALPRPWRCVIVGEGPERAQLERLATELGVSDRVELVGRRDEADVQWWLRRATVFVLACEPASTGDRDGIPVALMEAMASRVPVVTTRVGAIAELVDGVGTIVDPGDVGAIARAVGRDSSRDDRSRLADRAFERVASEWVADVTCMPLIDFLAARDREGTR